MTHSHPWRVIRWWCNDYNNGVPRQRPNLPSEAWRRSFKSNPRPSWNVFFGGWKNWMWLKLCAGNYCIYIYIIFFVCFFSWCEIVDVLNKSRLYCRFGTLQAQCGGYHHFAYYKCIDETQIRVTPWCWSLTCVTREFPQGSTGYGGGHKNSTRQMVRLQSHGFGHGLWC